MRSLISIIMRLWLLYLSLRYTSFQHFSVSVREICHCVLPQNPYAKNYGNFLVLPMHFLCFKKNKEPARDASCIHLHRARLFLSKRLFQFHYHIEQEKLCLFMRFYFRFSCSDIKNKKPRFHKDIQPTELFFMLFFMLFSQKYKTLYFLNKVNTNHQICITHLTKSKGARPPAVRQKGERGYPRTRKAWNPRPRKIIKHITNSCNKSFFITHTIYHCNSISYQTRVKYVHYHQIYGVDKYLM